MVDSKENYKFGLGARGFKLTLGVDVLKAVV